MYKQGGNMDVFEQKARLIEDSKRFAEEYSQRVQNLSRSYSQGHREWLRNRSEAQKELGERIYDLKKYSLLIYGLPSH
jgi:hypothetical protein